MVLVFTANRLPNQCSWGKLGLVLVKEKAHNDGWIPRFPRLGNPIELSTVRHFELYLADPSFSRSVSPRKSTWSLETAWNSPSIECDSILVP